MSRVENIDQASCHDRPVSHRLQHLPCGRCHTAIEYSQGTDWRVVNKLVNDHYEVCPMTPRAMLGHMARTPTSPSDTEIALFPLVAPEQRNGSNQAVSSPNNARIPSKRKTLEERKLELEQDEYTEDVTPKTVFCVGCHKIISLDKRSDYYPGLWNKHRDKCRGIEKLKCAEGKTARTFDGSRQVSCNAVSLSFNSKSCGDAPFQNHATSATRRFVPYDDLEDPLSDDEDEDSPLQAPFPMLNCAFYEAQLERSSSYEWTYRYSSKDEIATNLFRGQNEPYARPISHRACTFAGLRTGGHSETPPWMAEEMVHVPAAAGRSKS